jgi:hypothetical protein
VKSEAHPAGQVEATGNELGEVGDEGGGGLALAGGEAETCSSRSVSESRATASSMAAAENRTGVERCPAASSGAACLAYVACVEAFRFVLMA